MADSWQSMEKQRSFTYPPLYGTVDCKWYLRKIVKETCLRLAAGFPLEIDCGDQTEAFERNRPLRTSSNQDEQSLPSNPATPNHWQGEVFPAPVYSHTLATIAEERFDPNTTGYEQREDAEMVRLQRALRQSQHRLRRERRRIEASKPITGLRKASKKTTGLREASKLTTGLREASQEKLCPICLEAVCNWSLLCGHLFCEACVQQWANQSSTCPLCLAGLKGHRVYM
ncbi:MAG: hypothetical protein L6R37_008189 [Teloschistes peruensis]|nr:MAG: hypothetical protein L6R37_008189 [Teloschistes peruensis]